MLRFTEVSTSSPNRLAILYGGCPLGVYRATDDANQLKLSAAWYAMERPVLAPITMDKAPAGGADRG
jgi:hypothetical protein